MIRRLLVLAGAAAAGWAVYNRFVKPKPSYVTDGGDDWPDSEPPRANVPAMTPEPPPPATESSEPAVSERIRALVGDDAGSGATTTRDADAGTSAGDATTTIAEAATITIDAAAETDTERPIKGNVRADGDKIYHVPGDPAYERTKAEERFATAEEAEAAGFRRAGHTRDS